MTISTIVETDDYALQTCAVTNHNLLIRKADNAVCYLSDMDANILSESVDDLDTFNKIVVTFKFLDLLQEKNCNVKD